MVPHASLFVAAFYPQEGADIKGILGKYLSRRVGNLDLV
jgi:hypothetical protein